MEVILQENYPSLGYVGERVDVRRGYARNFLIPRGIAVECSSGNAKVLKHRIEMIARKKSKLLKEAKQEAQNMAGLILEFKLLLGKHGKSFGSITVKDIHSSLKAKGIEVDRKQIRLPEPIKTGGEFPLKVQLHAECSAEITIRVIAEKPAETSKPSKTIPSAEEIFDSVEE